MSREPRPARVLVVDDDQSVRDLVAAALRHEGFDVRLSTTVVEALATIDEDAPDVVVLDASTVGPDTATIQGRLAAHGSLARILTLARRGTLDERVRGLTLGGDDHLAKPFSLDELLARVRAILRRLPVGALVGGDGGTLVPVASPRYEVEDLVLDEELFEVRRAGEPIDLTPTEFVLLRYLLRHPRRVLSKRQILDHVWAYDFAGDGNIVETYISYLRRKIDHGRAPLVQTVRGVGYAVRPRR